MTLRFCGCGSSDLRASRLRLKDIPFLLILRYPMRCWVCRERVYIFIPRIVRMARTSELQNGEPPGLDKAQTS